MPIEECLDEDLETMSREQLIVETKKLRLGIAFGATALATSCAGAIRRCGPLARPFRSAEPARLQS
jgi:hypothetical protein